MSAPRSARKGKHRNLAVLEIPVRAESQPASDVLPAEAGARRDEVVAQVSIASDLELNQLEELVATDSEEAREETASAPTSFSSPPAPRTRREDTVKRRTAARSKPLMKTPMEQNDVLLLELEAEIVEQPEASEADVAAIASARTRVEDLPVNLLPALEAPFDEITAPIPELELDEDEEAAGGEDAAGEAVVEALPSDEDGLEEGEGIETLVAEADDTPGAEPAAPAGPAWSEDATVPAGPAWSDAQTLAPPVRSDDEDFMAGLYEEELEAEQQETDELDALLASLSAMAAKAGTGAPAHPGVGPTDANAGAMDPSESALIGGAPEAATEVTPASEPVRSDAIDEAAAPEELPREAAEAGAPGSAPSAGDDVAASGSSVSAASSAPCPVADEGGSRAAGPEGDGSASEVAKDVDGGTADLEPGAADPDPAPVVPDAAPVVPDAAPVVPDAAPVDLDAAPAVPDAAPVDPDAAPVDLDAVPMDLDAAPAVPDAPPAVLDAAPAVPDAAPANLDAAPAVPDPSPAASDPFLPVLEAPPAALLEAAAQEPAAGPLLEHLARMRDAHRAQDPAGVVAAFRDGVAVTPAAGPLYAYLGMALLGWRALPEARAILARGLEQDPDCRFLFEVLAEVELRLGRLDSARRLVTAAVARFAPDPAFLRRAARQAMRLGELRLARRLAARAAALAPETAPHALEQDIERRIDAVYNAARGELLRVLAGELETPIQAVGELAARLAAEPDAARRQHHLVRIGQHLGTLRSFTAGARLETLEEVDVPSPRALDA